MGYLPQGHRQSVAKGAVGAGMDLDRGEGKDKQRPEQTPVRSSFDGVEMRFRIVEFKPGRYKVQRRYLLVWAGIVKAEFVEVEDAERAILVYRRQKAQDYEDWCFIPRVVKEIRDGR